LIVTLLLAGCTATTSPVAPSPASFPVAPASAAPTVQPGMAFEHAAFAFDYPAESFSRGGVAAVRDGWENLLDIFKGMDVALRVSIDVRADEETLARVLEQAGMGPTSAAKDEAIAGTPAKAIDYEGQLDGVAHHFSTRIVAYGGRIYRIQGRVRAGDADLRARYDALLKQMLSTWTWK
jgi:hypothetical protein